MTLQLERAETPQRTAARRMHACGMSVLGVVDDGSKRPLGKWKGYQSTPSTPVEHDAWFGPGSTLGIGVVTGAVSGNLLMFEVEGRAADRIGELRDLAYATELGGLWEKVCGGWAELSPTGGVHWFVRLDHPAPGNQKLATDANGKVLAETRGEGGYCIVAPSNGTVHSSSSPWTRARGGPETVPEVTVDEYEDFSSLLATLGRSSASAPAATRFNQPGFAAAPRTGTLSPGDDFEARTDWADILEPHGWGLVRTCGRVRDWLRPGKSGPGLSATTGYAEDRERFYNFSTSAGLPVGEPLTKFAVFAHLNHGGDFKAAAADLRAQGYGDPTRPKDATHTAATRPAKPRATPITLDQAHAVFCGWFGDDYDTDALDAVLAAAACDQLDGDPLWLLLVSGSANAKTETVQSLDGIGATITSTITSTGALLSGTSTKERSNEATGGLLRKMGTTGVLVIKDFTSILSMDRNARLEVMGAVREVYDGRWERNVGTDGGRSLEWRGRLIVIGAVTTAWDRAHDVIAAMGDRFVLVRMDSTLNRQAAGRKAIGNTGHEDRMRAELAQAAAGVLATARQEEPITVSDGEAETIMEAANIVTLVRTGVDFDFKGEVIDAHAPEMPTRFAKQLAQVMRGAVVLGMDRARAMRLAIRCARDSMPPIRLAILDDVAAHPGSSTQEVRKRLQKPRASVDRQLQALHFLGVLTMEEEPVFRAGKGGTEWRYTLSPYVNPAAITQNAIPDLLVTPHKDTKKRNEKLHETVHTPSNKSGIAVQGSMPKAADDDAMTGALCPKHGTPTHQGMCGRCEAGV